MKEGKLAIWVLLIGLLLVYPAMAQAQKKPASTGPAASHDKSSSGDLSRQEQLDIELITAIAGENGDLIVKAISKGASVNARDREGITPLMHASLRGNPEVVTLLLTRGANVNATDIFGTTALMQAAWAGYPQIVRLLIDHGANPDLQSTTEVPSLKKKGVNALMGACMNGNTEVIELLLTREMKINAQDAEGQTALMYAAHFGYPAVLKMLLSRGAKTEMKDQFGRTALTIATIHGQADAVRVLLAAGANPHAKDIHNQKPIVYASALDQGEIYTMLKTAMSRKLPAESANFRRSPLQ